jgi:hypothetical protein
MSALNSRRLRTCAAITPLLAAGACFFPGVPTTLTQLPAELQLVADDPNTFAAPQDDPLADLTPGTAVDDLSGLTGCWGSFEPAEYSLGGAPTGPIYEVYQFDADDGTVSRWVSTPAFLVIPPVVAIDAGTFSILGEGQIEIHTTRYTVIDMRTGLGREFTDLPEAAATAEKLVTLSGDQLLIAVPYYVDEATGEPLGRIFSRFDCPE